jgi:5'-nucleotidase (lipoprotein e(P4) family)
MKAMALTLLLSVGAVGYCDAQAAARPSPAAAPSPDPKMPDSLHWMRNSAEYRASAVQTYAAATRTIDELARGRSAGWAVILDADETVLDNSQYGKEQKPPCSYSETTWDEWVERKAAGALPGAARFLRHVRAIGGRIAIVTNRSEKLCPATRENFDRLGLPYDVILCKGAASDKNPRFELVARGAEGQPPLEVLMWLGDNIRDFPGWSQDLRRGPESAFAAFGERFFVLPNSCYGSWTDLPRE